VTFVCRELLGESVRRCTGCCDDLADRMLRRGLKDVERPVDQNLERQPRLFSALRDTYCRLMADEVFAFGEVMDQVPITQIALDQVDPTRLESMAEIGFTAADQVVEYIDLGDTCGEQL